MSDSREAMRAAVEALEECCARFPAFGEWRHSRIDAALSLLRAALPVRQEPKALNGIPATQFHGEGAIARCSYCGRYSLDRKTLGEDRYQPVCECGEKHGWSGSFKRPGADAKWSGRAPEVLAASPAAAPVEARPVAFRINSMEGHAVAPNWVYAEVLPPQWTRFTVQLLYASPAAATQGDAPQAARDVLAERQRQISAEGWTPEHDDEHGNGELAFAAACYAHQAAARSWVLRELPDGAERYAHDEPPNDWPDSWDASWWRPKNQRRDLVRAAALLLAEIERIDRAAIGAESEQATEDGHHG